MDIMRYWMVIGMAIMAMAIMIIIRDIITATGKTEVVQTIQVLELARIIPHLFKKLLSQITWNGQLHN